MKNFFRITLPVILCSIILCSTGNAFQLNDKNSVNLTMPDNPSGNINSTELLPDQQIKNFLDEKGLPLVNSANSNKTDSAEGDSFQEYSFTGAAAVDYYGFAVASAGDVNADGFSDIMVGAPFNDAGGTDAGRVYIYFGNSVIDYWADVIITGNISGGKLGYSVSSAGDVNNDGFADVIAGAIGLTSNTGGANIYYGGSSMNNVADVVLPGQSAGELFGYSVAHAGDVNGDGYSDVVIGAYAWAGYAGRAYAFFGSGVMDNTVDLIFASGDPGSAFGVSVASAGDVNSDGFRDIIISELLGPGSYGKAFIYLGGQSMDNVADVQMTGATPADYFGSSVSSAGDMNGDGFDDVIVGAFYFNSQAGAAYIFYGGTNMNSAADVTLNGVATTDLFGGSVSGAGDVNGDGFKDVIVGSRQNDGGGSNSGCAYLFWGGPVVNNVPDAIFNGSTANDLFGFSVASAGDVNRDGYTDLIIGTPYNDQAGSDAGKAWLYTNTRNYNISPIASFSGPGGNDYFALKSSSAGDLNGDGYDDVMATSINYEQVYIFLGGRFIDNSVDLILYAPNSPESFSGSISSAGDLNNDGYDDIIIGAENSSSTVGRAYVYFGSANMNNVPDVIMSGAAANNYFGSAVSGAGDVNGDSYDDVIVGQRGNGRAFVFYGGSTVDNIPDVTLINNVGSFGISVAGVRDVNGDSYDDVVVGAPNEGAEGRVYLYLGGISMNNISDLTMSGVGNDTKFGSGVAAAGDVNGDGFDDVLVSGRNPSFIVPDSRGRAELFYGGAIMNAIADITMIGLDANYQLGGCISTINDYNKDGYEDFAVTSYPAKRVYIHFGGTSVDNVPDLVLAGEEVNTNIYFGMSATYAGDVNGDGNPDIIAGGYGLSAPGNAYIFSYSNTKTDTDDGVFKPEGAGDWMGYAIASAGDVNGDSFSDVIVGARLNDGPGTDAGRAYIYFGGNPMDYVPDVILNGTNIGDQFGFSVACAGDVNADLYSDVIVGAPLNDAAGGDAGRAYIFYGGVAMNNVPDVILTGELPGNQFGFRVASAGNFNGDNIGDIWSDVIVGSPYNDGGGTSSGRAYVYFGNYTMNNAVDVVLTGEAAFDNFGVSVASAGDVNGDTYGDLIIGASGNDGFALDAGRAYVFYGGPSPNNVADIILNGTTAGDWFGYSTASAGDVNSDGYGDLVVGAFRNDQAGTDAGRAYFFYGGNPMNTLADMNYYGENAGDWLGICVSSAGDVNSDGIPDLIIGALYNDAGGTDAGRAYVHFGSVNINNSPDLILTGKTGEYFGWFVANAGDVNADGQSDPLVGAYNSSLTSSQGGRGYMFISSYPANHCILTLKMILQAFYQPGPETMYSSDTVTVNLRSSSYPYSIVDQAKAVISKVNFTGKFYFNNAPSGSYYLDIRHRNSIETWSTSPMNFTRNVNTNYDLTTSANKAYGNNMILIDNSPVRYSIYSGDTNQDGIVDATDALLIDNDANNYLTGYLNTDVNGDYSVDATDALLVDNNSNNFVSKITP